MISTERVAAKEGAADGARSDSDTRAEGDTLSDEDDSASDSSEESYISMLSPGALLPTATSPLVTHLLLGEG